METADVVVVGGGIVGASVAWHLTQRGCRDVIVVERASRPGEGSTGRATGGFRAQFGTGINVQLSLLARRQLLRFEDDTGMSPGYAPRGYLFLAATEEGMRSLRAALAVQRGVGLVESREVGREEIADVNPPIGLDGIVGGAFCPTDGFIRPLDMLRGYVESASRQGVGFRWGMECHAIRVAEGLGGIPGIASIETTRGPISTGCVVVAAGAWAARVAAQAGAGLPVVPERRQVAVTHPFGGLPESMPMTVFLEDGFHLRVREGRVLLLWPRETRMADPFDTRFDPAWLDGLMARAIRSVPCLGATTIDPDSCHAGLYEMSPDGHAILGESPEVRGLYFANGSSGHGVMHAPALGKLLAEIILDGAASTLDVRPLRPARFTEGEPNPSGSLL